MKNKIKILMGTTMIAIMLISNIVHAENVTTENVVENITTETNTSETENTATNETNTINTTSNESKKDNKTTTNTTNSKTTNKSSNANLKNLGIKPNDFSGFKPGTTSYKTEVPYSVEKVEVYAQAQDSNAKISGTGNQKLQEGQNNLTVTVTAEDGTVKTYTINVIRLSEEESEEEKKEQEDEIEESEYVEGEGLASIQIENANIDPEFQTNVYEYKVKYIGEETQLDIKVEPTDNSYIVEITGNEELQEGENIITILVSDKEGNNVATYQLIVNKKLVDEEAIAREKEEQRRMLIIAGAAGIVVIAIVVAIVIIKRRKDNEVAKEYTLPYTSMDNEEDYRALLETNEPKREEVTDDMSKESARKEFLESYSNDGYQEEIPKKKKVKSKGKRFK